ncbi:MAG TPA: hypothetical protein VK796_13560 [Cytophaga sp.]|jgi:hypothetical protein|nr:hypothetical protein [Cytophaga sp.]
MQKLIFSICLLSAIVFSGCNGAVDPDNASAITATYAMTTYNTQAGNNSNPPSGNNLIVTKVDKNNVKVVIAYASNPSADVTLDKMAITKNGSTYNLAESFTNASSSGSVTGNTITLDVNYTNNNYVHIIGVK